VEYTVEDSVITIKTHDGSYSLLFYSPEILEVSFLPLGENATGTSHAVIATPQKIDIKVAEENETISFSSEGISILLQKRPFQLIYIYKEEVILSEKKGYTSIKKGLKQDFNLEESEILMGGGARALGMNRRGNRLQLYNRAHYGYEIKSELMNYTIPMVLSSKKYALHFDNPTVGYLDLDSNKSNTLAFEATSGSKKYQLIVGGNWESILKNYTHLTGRQPLPARWVLGNFSSRFGYHSQKEVEKTIAAFQKEQIPVDAIILDLYWFGHTIKETMGNLAFVKDSFPNPKKMMADLKEKGIKTVLITEPFILTTSNRWEEALEEEILALDTLGNPGTYDFYFGNTGLIDVFNPKAIDWFWNIYKDLKDYGVAGWWGDLGEPEVHPEYLRHHTGTANEVHNIYGHQWAKIIFDGYVKNYPEQRPFILMRAGYSGSQRLGMIPWSGDVNRSWGGLKPQTEITLQMGLQGLGYMHSDLGGFAGDLLDDELYVRWLQFGVFQPVFRPHAQEEVPSEPVFRAEKAKKLSKKAIELRYKLLPYNYTIAFENSQNGMPLMRPLFFEEPDNYQYYHISETYLWGNDLLISPVVSSGLKTQKVYFPSTSHWFDFYSGKKMEGGKAVFVELVEENIPTYVRAGAFIPFAPLVQTTDDYNVKILDVHYYHDPSVTESSGQIYHDDGLTANAYEKGRYEKLHLKSKSLADKLEFELNKEIGNDFSTTFEVINFTIHNGGKVPKKVKTNGKNYDFTFDKETQNITINNLQLNTIQSKVVIDF
jgi:alpha-glucosidase (family GH31 glycosyl hydrolase)